MNINKEIQELRDMLIAHFGEENKKGNPAILTGNELSITEMVTKVLENPYYIEWNFEI